jgi:hypothetical protein
VEERERPLRQAIQATGYARPIYHPMLSIWNSNSLQMVTSLSQTLRSSVRTRMRMISLVNTRLSTPEWPTKRASERTCDEFSEPVSNYQTPIISPTRRWNHPPGCKKEDAVMQHGTANRGIPTEPRRTHLSIPRQMADRAMSDQANRVDDATAQREYVMMKRRRE